MTNRLYYLDALRSFCMLFGILVHTGTLQSGAWPGSVSAMVSEHFRMATFFVISGFFAVMMLDKRGLGGFARHRAISLGVPLLTALLVLNPLTLWLIYQVETGPVGLWSFLTGNAPPPAERLNWHLHLWFLFTLIAYMAALPLLMGLVRSGAMGRAAGWLTRQRGDVMALMLTAAMITGEIAGRALFALLFEPVVGGTPVSWLFRATLQYAPFFILGAVSFVHRDLFEALHRISWPLLALGLALSLLRPLLGLSGGLGTLAEIIAEETLTVAIMLALFALFRRFLSGRHRSVEMINDGVYSIYLLHYGLIYALAWWVFGAVTPFEAKFVIVVLATFVIAFALHHGVIRRLAPLYFLLNGKRRLAPGKP